MATATDEQEPVSVILRANLTRQQWKQLRLVAVEKDTTVPNLVGALIVVYLQEREEFSS